MSEDSTNPNVDTSGEESVDSGFGETAAVSFDDMESIMDSAEGATEVEAAPKEESNSDEEDVSSDTQEDEVSAEAELKLIKAMRGEDGYDIPEDAMFTQKVNGVEEQVSIKDLLSDYSGKTDWTRKYSELGAERQELKKSQFEFDTRVNTFVEKAKESKIDALAYLAETAGADPAEFIREFKQGLIPDLEEYMGMSQTERELYDRNQELDIIKKSKETQATIETTRQEQARLQEQVETQLQELGIEQQDYAAAYDRLVESNTLPSDQIGPEAVAQWIGLENRVKLVDSTLMEIDSNLADDVALIEDLVRTSLQGGLDEQATMEVIKEMYGQTSKEAQSASNKVRQSGANLKSVTNKIVKEDSAHDHYSGGDESGPMSFDDI